MENDIDPIEPPLNRTEIKKALRIHKEEATDAILSGSTHSALKSARLYQLKRAELARFEASEAEQVAQLITRNLNNY